MDTKDMKVLEPWPLFGPGAETFPGSDERPEGTICVDWPGKKDNQMIDVLPNVVYQSLSGEDQHFHLIRPIDPMAMFMPDAPKPKLPLVVYVPGSAWHRQNIWMGLDRACYFASKGYAFAIVEYRPVEVAIYPAQVRDAEAATRFLLDHAEEYGIDPDRVAFWGDSSGGHTVVCLAVEKPEMAKCVVDWFGPTDIGAMSYYPSALPHYGSDTPEALLIGGKDVLEYPELAQTANPINGITPEKDLPPFLIMHGAMDNIVPFNQSVRLYEKLKACGKEATFYRLENAGHGVGGFSSDEALETSFRFIAEHLKG